MPQTITYSPLQTQQLAKKLAIQLKGGEVLALVGDLGTGKTEFTKGVAKAFGVRQAITSPTFVLMKVYGTKKPAFTAKRTTKQAASADEENIKHLVHIDCYRLHSARELVDIGAAEYFGQKNTITIIEWADKIKKILPRQVVWVEFGLGEGENERIISIKENG